MQFSKSGYAPLSAGRVSLILRTIFVGFLGIIAVLVAISMFVGGHPLAGIGALGFTALTILAPVFGWRTRLSNTYGIGVLQSVQRSTIRYRRGDLHLITTLVVLGLILAIAFGRTGGRYGAIVAVSGLFCATYFYPLATGKIRSGWVELTPEGIRHRGSAFDAFAPWSGIQGLTRASADFPFVQIYVDENHPLERHYTTLLWRIETLPKRRALSLDCRRFDVHPHALADWLEFYIRYPAARVELGTDVAAQRFAGLG